jgi:hypothetical protein
MELTIGNFIASFVLEGQPMSIAAQVDRVARFEEYELRAAHQSFHRCGAEALKEGQFRTEPLVNRSPHCHIRLFRRPNSLVLLGRDLFCDRGVNKPLLPCESGADLAHG